MASTMSSRHFILEVINKYQERPCLWQVTHPSYRNKMKRNKALDDFLELFRSVDPNANRETVQKKLSSIRSSFNKEQRKVQISLLSGSGSENVHVPKLWYFDHLSFLADPASPGKCVTPACLLDDKPFGEEEIDDGMDDSRSESSQMSSAASSSPTSSKCFRRPQQKADAILNKIAKRMEQPVVPLAQNPIRLPYDAFGQHIAEKMRSMPASMVPFCEKIISEAIFLAEFEKLNVTSKIVTDDN
ncbi:hypothetical protein GE061_004011 [Apolygus lucorum]|uniref:Uncharacterized protein n=1 Tax=Apolygus lucorum TaxID=248454 RepID=A0A6A4K9F7_APOLU|nr:hypothetical protein GE061_004011 [Apolygus lucorum]